MNTKRRNRKDLGFTQVELLLALGIGIILLGLAVFPFFLSQIKSYTVQDETAKMQQRARTAQDFIVRSVQQAGAFALTGSGPMSIRGRPILGAGDRFIAVQYDDPESNTPGRISADEVVMFALSKPGGTTTETITVVDASFDRDNDGTVEESEEFNWEVPLALGGPPYNLYRITPDPSDPTGDPIMELVATNVDNLIFKYYDGDGRRIPSESDGEPSPMPYDLDTEGERIGVKTVEVELVLASEKPDDKYSQDFALEDNSVGTYTTDGTPRTGFVLSNQTAYVASGALPNQFRRRNYTTITSIRNITATECGTIELSASPESPRCPDPTVVTATVLNGEGNPVADGTPVNFTMLTPGPALTPASATTVGGIATTTMSYTGAKSPFTVEAVAMIACGDPPELRTSKTINFVEGDPVQAKITQTGYTIADMADQPAPPDASFVTCRDDFFVFSILAYDQCDNVVDPTAPLTFRTVAGTDEPLGTISDSDNVAGGWGAPGDTASFQVGKNAFRIDRPTGAIAATAPTATPTDVATGRYDILVRAQDVLPAWITQGFWFINPLTGIEETITGPPYNVFTIPLFPWPPADFTIISDPDNPDTSKIVSNLGVNFATLDCNTVPIPDFIAPNYSDPEYDYVDTLVVTDCKGNRVANMNSVGGYSIDAFFTHTTGVLGPESIGGLGKPPVPDPPNPVTNLINLESAYANSEYKVFFAKNGCTIDPDLYADSNPYVDFTLRSNNFVNDSGPVTVTKTYQINMRPCRTCGLTTAADIVTTCEGYADVTVGGCDFVNKDVLLTIDEVPLLPAAGQPYWVDRVTHLPLNGIKSREATVVTGPDGTVTAKLSIGDAASLTTLTVRAGSTSAEVPPWSCQNEATITVSNECMDFRAFYKTDIGIQDIVNGGSYCAQQLSTLFFQIEHCRHEGGIFPNPVTVIIRDQFGQDFDIEDIDLIGLVSTVDPVTPPYRFFEGEIKVFPNPSAQGNHHNLKLEYPQNKGSSMIIRPWVNVNDPSDSCPDSGDWSTTLIPPLPLCFPNAITSGGGASWNGNFKVHWGDVVVRGQVTVPTANKRIAKSAAGQYDGNPFGGTGNSDRLFDLYVGKAGTTSLDDGLIQGLQPPAGHTGVYQPFKNDVPIGYGHYFTNISSSRINEMVVLLNYDLMRGLAMTHSNNSYWCAIPTTPGSLYNPRRKVSTTFAALMQYPNANNNGDFLFLDSWCQAGPGGAGPLWISDTALTDAIINATPMTKPAGKTILDALPRWTASGSFFTKGITYIAGSLEFGGLGATTPVTVKAPPNKDLRYDHNTAVFDESELPIRPDPTAARSSFTLGVHVNGAIYVDGEFAGNGNPSVFGAINSERGYSGSGSPELWYNYALNQSTSDGNSLCVDCCKINATPRAIDMSPGDTTSIDVRDFTEPLIFQTSDPDIATVTAGGVVTAVAQGTTSIWIVDKNNCSIMIPVRVSTQCVGLALRPDTVPENPAVPFELVAGVEPTAYLQVVDAGGETYPFAAWAWSATPNAVGETVVEVSPVASGAYSAWITGKKCGTSVVTARDTLEYCTGIYESFVTVSSALDISTITPLKDEYEVGETVTLTATGGSGTLTWHASPAGAVEFNSSFGATVTATFKQPASPLLIDVSDSLDCVSAGKNFFVRCPTPTLVTDFPFDGSEWGLDSTNGRNLYWKITPSDDHLVDPLVPSTMTDQLNKVNFTITPPAGVVWPPYPLNAAPRDEFTTEFCGLAGGDVCSSNPTDISSWKSGEYTFTGTGTATYTEPLVIAACGATRNASTSIKVNIDNCFLDYTDYFTSLTPEWSLNCLDNGCNAGLSYRNIISGDLLAVTAVNNNASTGPAVLTVDNALYHTTTSSTFVIEARISGLTDTDPTPGLISGAGLVMTTDKTKEKVNSVTFAGYADPNAAWDTPHNLIMYYFNGASMSAFNTGVMLTPPYDLRIEKTTTGGYFVFKYKNSSATNWTTAVTLSYGAYPVGANFYSGLFVDTPNTASTNAEGWFDYYKQTCY
ncbi:hypothetical protein EPN96_07815 [bacterium]|nr:MAG: hypothetical protein EPN96_07815 [bacterium]